MLAFAVFDELDDGIKVALELRDYFAKGDWSELGLMDGLEIRISIHAGPVYEKFDPILGIQRGLCICNIATFNNAGNFAIFNILTLKCSTV